MPGADGRSLAAVDSCPYPIRTRTPIRNHRRSHQKTRQRRPIHRRKDHRLPNNHRPQKPNSPRIRQHSQPHRLGNHPKQPPDAAQGSHDSPRNSLTPLRRAMGTRPSAANSQGKPRLADARLRANPQRPLRRRLQVKDLNYTTNEQGHCTPSVDHAIYCCGPIKFRSKQFPSAYFNRIPTASSNTCSTALK